MALSELDVSDEMDECIDNCFEATQACEWCADESLDEEMDMSRCIRLCRDVADIANTHARFMVRNSAYSADLAETCADACEECAEECRQHDHDHCQTCADVLEECAETCREMAA